MPRKNDALRFAREPEKPSAKPYVKPIVQLILPGGLSILPTRDEHTRKRGVGACTQTGDGGRLSCSVARPPALGRVPSWKYGADKYSKHLVAAVLAVLKDRTAEEV